MANDGWMPYEKGYFTTASTYTAGSPTPESAIIDVQARQITQLRNDIERLKHVNGMATELIEVLTKIPKKRRCDVRLCRPGDPCICDSLERAPGVLYHLNLTGNRQVRVDTKVDMDPERGTQLAEMIRRVMK